MRSPEGRCVPEADSSGLSFFRSSPKCSVTHRDMGKVITLTFFVVPIIMPANLNFRQRLRVWLSQAWGWDDVS